MSEASGCWQGLPEGSLERECAKRAHLVNHMLRGVMRVPKPQASITGVVAALFNDMKDAFLAAMYHNMGGRTTHKGVQLTILKRVYCELSVCVLAGWLRMVNPANLALAPMCATVKTFFVDVLGGGGAGGSGKADVRLEVEEEVKGATRRLLKGLVVHCSRGKWTSADSTMGLWSALIGVDKGRPVAESFRKEGGGRLARVGGRNRLQVCLAEFAEAFDKDCWDDERESVVGLRTWLLEKQVCSRLGFAGLKAEMRADTVRLCKEIIEGGKGSFGRAELERLMVALVKSLKGGVAAGGGGVMAELLECAGMVAGELAVLGTGGGIGGGGGGQIDTCVGVARAVCNGFCETAEGGLEKVLAWGRGEGGGDVGEIGRAWAEFESVGGGGVEGRGGAVVNQYARGGDAGGVKVLEFGPAERAAIKARASQVLYVLYCAE